MGWTPPPLPGRLLFEGDLPFVGREFEWGILENAWEAVESGQRQVVFVAGEPGAGKTRLVGEAAVALHQLDVAVLYGTSFADFGVPYQPFVECLEHLFAGAEPGGFRDVLPESAHHLRRLTPLIAETDISAKEQVPGMREDRQELFAAFRDLMHALTKDRAVALILEDLHWENEPTRQLLSYLVQASESDRLLIMATHRSTPPDRNNELANVVASLYRLPGVHRVDLSGLEVTDITKCLMMSGVTDHSEARRSAVLLRDQTGGNPFFIRELLQRRRAGLGREWPVATPATVIDAIGVRLANLETDARKMVELAAVIGNEFDVDTLVAVTNDPEFVLSHLDHVMDAGLVTSQPGVTGAFRFRHALTRQAVLAGMSASARPKAHAQIAKALVTAWPDTPQRDAVLAYHYDQASSIGYGHLAAEHAARAGKRAEESFAYEDAAGWFRMAADHGGPGIRDRWLLYSADNLVQAGRYDDARPIYQDLVNSTDLRLAGLAAIGFEDATWRPGRDGNIAAAVIDRVLGAMDDDPGDPLYIRLLASKARALVYAGRYSSDLSTRAVQMARALGDQELLAATLIASINQLADPFELDIQRERCREVLAWAESVGALEATAHAAAYLGILGYMTGDTTTRREARALAVGAVETGDLLLWRWMTGCGIYVDHFIRGDLDLARQQAMSLPRLGTGLAGELSGPFGFQMFMVEREAGRLNLVRQVVEENHGSDQAWGLALLSLRTELGQLHAVESLIETVFDQELAKPRLTAEWPGMLALLAEAVIALGDKKLADRLRPHLLEYSGLNLIAGGNTAAFGAADRYIAQIDAILGLPSAESEFEAALELDARTGATLHEVETLIAYAKFLDYSNDHRRIGRATEFRQRARAIAEDKNLIRQLRRLDESTSLRSDRPAGLTRREITVLRLIAEGLSNREIADLLFISENTAANHVRSILVKTQAPNRTRAAIFAAQHGILD